LLKLASDKEKSEKVATNLSKFPKKPLFPQDNEKDSETLLKKRLRMDKYS